MNYLRVFKLNQVVEYQKKQLVIKALYDKGAVCRTIPDGELDTIEGLDQLKEVTLCQSGAE